MPKATQAQRLQWKIWKLISRYEGGHIPIGGDNPYYQCAECGVSDPYLDIEVSVGYR